MAEKFLILNTVAEALAASHAAYRRRTPNWNATTHKTMYLVGYVRPVNAQDARAALRIPDAEQASFTAGERTAMRTKAQINADGWEVNGRSG
jgi:hypothetical protein